MSKPLPNPIVPGTYLTRCGDEALVTEVSDNPVERYYPVLGVHYGGFECWTTEGHYIAGDPGSAFDLVSLVSDEPPNQPTPGEHTRACFPPRRNRNNPTEK